MTMLEKYRYGHHSDTIRLSVVSGVLYVVSLGALICGLIFDNELISYISLSVLVCIYILLFLNNWRVNRKLREASHVDIHTGGNTKFAFQAEYQRAIRKKPNPSMAIVMLNVRNFHVVNDRYGFESGNRLLKAIYRCIEQELHTERFEFASRGDADHFFICLDEHEPAVIQQRLDQILERFQRTDVDGRTLRAVTILAGCCIASDPAEDLNILKEHARLAEKNNKPEYRRCLFYDGEIVAQQERENSVILAFEEALATHEFEVYLQPKVALQDSRCVGAEALVRWNRPGVGMVPPSAFIPALERSGQICELDLFVFAEVCKLYRKRELAGEPWYPVSLNLSRYHFYERDFFLRFLDIARPYHLKPGSIEFELTETMFFDQQVDGIEDVNKLIHENGFLCSVDDFGTGYSSLGMLKDYHLDTVKLDRAFFVDIEAQRARDVVQGIVDLIKKLGMQVVAEGIETDEQIVFLKSIGCNVVQGFYFSKPLPVSEFELWIKNPG